MRKQAAPLGVRAGEGSFECNRRSEQQSTQEKRPYSHVTNNTVTTEIMLTIRLVYYSLCDQAEVTS